MQYNEDGKKYVLVSLNPCTRLGHQLQHCLRELTLKPRRSWRPFLKRYFLANPEELIKNKLPIRFGYYKGGTKFYQNKELKWIEAFLLNLQKTLKQYNKCSIKMLNENFKPSAMDCKSLTKGKHCHNHFKKKCEFCKKEEIIFRAYDYKTYCSIKCAKMSFLKSIEKRMFITDGDVTLAYKDYLALQDDMKKIEHEESFQTKVEDLLK